jgi:hypothetical protein
MFHVKHRRTLCWATRGPASCPHGIRRPPSGLQPSTGRPRSAAPHIGAEQEWSGRAAPAGCVAELGLDFCAANELGSADGRLTGRIVGRSWTDRARRRRCAASPRPTGCRCRSRWRWATARTTSTCSPPPGWASRSTPSRPCGRWPDTALSHPYLDAVDGHGHAGSCRHGRAPMNRRAPRRFACFLVLPAGPWSRGARARSGDARAGRRGLWPPATLPRRSPK